MRTTHKRVGNIIGRADERAFDYEYAITALSDEELIERMVEHRINNSQYPSSELLRSVSIGVLLENLRRAKMLLPPEGNEWGIYYGGTSN